MQEAYGNATNTQEQTYQRQHPKGPCFNCRKMGHFTKDCHSNPSSNISYMDMEDDDMQNVPQPNITPRTNVSHLKVQIDALSMEDNDALIEAMGSSQGFTPA
jgi:Zinc knuckle